MNAAHRSSISDCFFGFERGYPSRVLRHSFSLQPLLAAFSSGYYNIFRQSWNSLPARTWCCQFRKRRLSIQEAAAFLRAHTAGVIIKQIRPIRSEHDPNTIVRIKTETAGGREPCSIVSPKARFSTNPVLLRRPDMQTALVKTYDRKADPRRQPPHQGMGLLSDPQRQIRRRTDDCGQRVYGASLRVVPSTLKQRRRRPFPRCSGFSVRQHVLSRKLGIGRCQKVHQRRFRLVYA